MFKHSKPGNGDDVMELHYEFLIFGFVASNTFFLMELPGQAAKILAATLLIWCIIFVTPTIELCWNKIFKIKKAVV